MKTHRATIAVLGMVICLAASPVRGMFAAEASTHGQAAEGTSEQQMMEHCQQAMAQHQQMMSQMKAAEAELDKLLNRMNVATGDEKVEAIAAVVNEMVKQRRAMHTQMMRRHEQMMSHMMEHMQMGDRQAMQRSMRACPMMHRTQPGQDEPSEDRER